MKESDMSFRIILIFAGCLLLLLGNTLSWPCISGLNSYECYPVLHVWHTNNPSNQILLLLGILSIVAATLATNLLKSPLDYISWLSILLLVYILTVPRLGHDSFFGYSPLVDINQRLAGPSYFVMPISLLAYWLVLRPEDIQKKWRLGTVICLFVLIFLTGYFFILSAFRLFLFSLTPSPFADTPIFGSGPLLILVGGVLLLGTEFWELKRDKKSASSQEEALVATTSTRYRKMLNVGFWSAILTTVSAISPIILALASNYAPFSHQYDPGVSLLFSAIQMGLSLLLPLSFAVLMISINNYVSAEKKIWTRIGLFLGIMYAIIQISNTCLNLVLSISYPLYHQLVMIFPFLSRYGVLNYLNFVLISLAGLSVLPVFNKSGIELAIRWCFIIIGAATIIGGLGYMLSSNRIPTLPLLVNLVAQSIVFPLATALLAVVFRRAEKAQV